MTSLGRLITALFVSTVLPVISGCGSSDLELAEVSGVVTLDGQPVAGAVVNTQPIPASAVPSPGPGSFGRTDEQGRFTLELVS